MKDTEHLKLVLQHVSGFAADELEAVVSCFQPLTVRRQEPLLMQGEVCSVFYFVHKGCIRTGFYTPEGQEKTRYVMCDSFVGTALASFINRNPSFEFMDALEDSELLVIRHSDFFQLNEQSAAWRSFYQRMLEMAYTFQTRKIESRMTLSARQRYEQLLREQPQLCHRLSNKVLASYLDMTQETLSRLKTK